MNSIFLNFFHDKSHFYQCVIKYHMLKNELLHVNKNVRNLIHLVMHIVISYMIEIIS